ncbi:zinc-binding dehydrogenase [Aldersonia sp. NBC_00410]|uniref:zinc-binding dehydrogenase n=1 Tax=Aldersonia sp. NBC_00410 TaxID=2975954 RepID=UPI0022505EAB|nr:zinc-binding dehydrogenase [Aldersonia sp. NBC_00410]MCX5043030.1 zinc-binding dehydrogenase [Aldersonia sp. NBC_00410]
MEAVVVREFGPAENMHLERVPDPVPPPGSVRIAVAAAGVHVVDTRVRAGRQLGPFPLPELPYIPGREVVGTVESVGAPADEHLLGAEVAVSLGNANGGYAPLAITPAAALHLVDPTLDPATAATMVGTGRTALGLLDAAALTGDDTVLVTAAAGGVGSLLVQLAHRAGVPVVAVAGGPAKAEIALGLGATLAVDYLDADWPSCVRAAGLRPTVLFDAVGGRFGDAAIDLLERGGRVVAFGDVAGSIDTTDAQLADRDITRAIGVGPGSKFTPENIRRWAAQALAMAAAGELTATTTRFSLADAANAHARLESRTTIGKVVLDVA